MAPDDFEDTAGNDEAVEPVERRLEVDPRSQGPHAEQHLENEETQEHEFGSICKKIEIGRHWLYKLQPFKAILVSHDCPNFMKHVGKVVFSTWEIIFFALLFI